MVMIHLFFFLLKNISSNAQNLVLNHSFEELNLGHSFSQLTLNHNEFNTFFSKWNNPAITTPDVYVVTDKKKLVCPISQKPKTGNCMVGISCYSPAIDQESYINQDWHEYIQGTLSEPLIIGKKYYIEFWVLERESSINICENKVQPRIRGNTAVACNNIGLLFTDTLIEQNIKKTTIKAQPNIFSPDIIYAKDSNWHKISGYIIADKNYKFFTIGNFFSDMETQSSIKDDDKRKILKKQGTNEVYKIARRGYYFIDDVKVEESEKENILSMPKMEVGDSFVLNNILFDTGKSNLTAFSYKELDILVESIKKAGKFFEIQGHTDNEGNEPFNLKLSEARAKSVYDYFILKGVDYNIIGYKGFGSSQPISSNFSKNGRQLNRRVQLVVINTTSISKNKISALESKIITDTLEQIYHLEEDCREDFEFSRIGLYNKAIDKACSSEALEKLSVEDSIDFFTKFKPVLAIDHILKKTRNEKAVFINEAHHMPQHRAFTTLMLKSLYKQGFRYFGIETLSYQDVTRLNETKYPSIYSGYYATEPIYGDLIRQAIAIGFNVFPYESTNKNEESAISTLKQDTTSKQEETEIEFMNPDGSKTTLFEQNLRMNARDFIQAQNISAIFKNDTSAKVLIHCGYGHIKEKESNGWKTMAYQFRKLCGIDPLTIDQTEMSEKCIDDENSIYNRIKKNIKTPLIFIDNKGNSFVQKEYTPLSKETYTSFYDIQVFHPTSKYFNERPDWLSLNGYRKPYRIDPKMILVDLPCLVLAYKDNEDLSKSIPVDIIQLKSKNDSGTLMLPSGSYILMMKNKQSSKQAQKINIE